MQIRYSKLSIAFLLLFMVFTSCEDDLAELNENPNQPEEVTADVLLTSAIRSSMTTMVNESFLLGNNAAQLTAKTLRAEIDIYSWNSFPTVWDGMYQSLANIVAMEEIAIETGNANFQGIALVMKSWMFSVVTDAYGDIPYNEAIRGVSDGDYLPAYDTQEEIYTGSTGLIAQLERANSLLGTGGDVSGDIIFDGDVSKWKKLANSLRLRLLMRMSGQVDVSGAIQALASSGELMQSNDDNAVLDFLSSFPNEFPLIPLKQGDFDAVAMSERSVNVMQQYRDPRLARYARPDNLDFDNPLFSGAVNGSESPALCDKSGSRLGLAYFDYPGHPITANHADGILMTYSEVEFLLAEAALKGYIADDIESHYRAGIQASMDYYEVDYAPFAYTDFNDYYTNSGVAYDEPIDIWEQKWLALFFTGLEPYFEVRRWMKESNFDWNAIRFLEPTCENVNNDALPVRFPYPGDEQSLNSANYQAAISRLGGNSQNTAIWLVQ